MSAYPPDPKRKKAGVRKHSRPAKPTPREYKTDEAGATFFDEKGVRYVKTGERYYRNKLGRQCAIETWRGHCLDCGGPFTATQPKDGFSFFRRRCKACVRLRREGEPS